MCFYRDVLLHTRLWFEHADVFYLECREKDKENGDESKKDQRQNEAKEKIPESSESTEESSKETKQEEVNLLHGTVSL